MIIKKPTVQIAKLSTQPTLGSNLPKPLQVDDSTCNINLSNKGDHMKNVQIPEQLLIDLCNYHILGVRNPALDMRINQGLQQKLEAVQRRAAYQKQRRDNND